MMAKSSKGHINLLTAHHNFMQTYTSLIYPYWLYECWHGVSWGWWPCHSAGPSGILAHKLITSQYTTTSCNRLERTALAQATSSAHYCQSRGTQTCHFQFILFDLILHSSPDTLWNYDFKLDGQDHRSHHTFISHDPVLHNLINHHQSLQTVRNFRTPNWNSQAQLDRF